MEVENSESPIKLKQTDGQILIIDFEKLATAETFVITPENEVLGYLEVQSSKFENNLFIREIESSNYHQYYEKSSESSTSIFMIVTRDQTIPSVQTVNELYEKGEDIHGKASDDSGFEETTNISLQKLPTLSAYVCEKNSEPPSLVNEKLSNLCLDQPQLSDESNIERNCQADALFIPYAKLASTFMWVNENASRESKRSNLNKSVCPYVHKIDNAVPMKILNSELNRIISSGPSHQIYNNKSSELYNNSYFNMNYNPSIKCDKQITSLPQILPSISFCDSSTQKDMQAYDSSAIFNGTICSGLQSKNVSKENICSDDETMRKETQLSIMKRIELNRIMFHLSKRKSNPNLKKVPKKQNLSYTPEQIRDSLEWDKLMVSLSRKEQPKRITRKRKCKARPFEMLHLHFPKTKRTSVKPKVHNSCKKNFLNVRIQPPSPKPKNVFHCYCCDFQCHKFENYKHHLFNCDLNLRSPNIKFELSDQTDESSKRNALYRIKKEISSSSNHFQDEDTGLGSDTDDTSDFEDFDEDSYLYTQEFLINLMECVKDDEVSNHLVGIFSETIKSHRHTAYFSDDEYTKLAMQPWFGPISCLDTAKGLYEHLCKLFEQMICRDHLSSKMLCYIYQVWCPEAIVKAISMMKGITIEEAEIIFSNASTLAKK